MGLEYFPNMSANLMNATSESLIEREDLLNKTVLIRVTESPAPGKPENISYNGTKRVETVFKPGWQEAAANSCKGIQSREIRLPERKTLADTEPL